MRIKVKNLAGYHASNQIESVQQYNVLMNYILDVNMTQSQKAGLSASYGTSPSSSLAGSAVGVLNTECARQGAFLRGREYISGASVAVNQQITICMPVLSGVFGLGSDKYLCIGKLSDDLRVEISWENLATAMVYTNALSSGVLPGTAGWSITDVQLELSITELSDEGESMVNSMLDPSHPIYLHHNSWRHYSSILPASSSGTYTTLIPARFGSLKSLTILPRSAATNTNPGMYCLSSRCNPNISQYYCRCGSNLIPPKYITLENDQTTGAYGEGFLELQKCWHSVSSPANASNLPAFIYNVADTAASSGTAVLTAVTGAKALSTVNLINTTGANGSATTSAVNYSTLSGNTYLNGFAIAQELESFALRGDVLLSGLNTLSQQVFFEAVITNATSANAYTLNCYANYDGILVLENGILSVRF